MAYEQISDTDVVDSLKGATVEERPFLFKLGQFTVFQIRYNNGIIFIRIAGPNIPSLVYFVRDTSRETDRVVTNPSPWTHTS